jgi:hypothetical protein
LLARNEVPGAVVPSICSKETDSIDNNHSLF